MATARDLAEAHAFGRRRLVTAFVSGVPAGNGVEPLRPGRTLVGGVALAVLLVAGAGVAGMFSPRDPAGWTEPGLVVSRETGAAYVILEQSDHPVLRPVDNITSARLALDPGVASTPRIVSQQSIDAQNVMCPTDLQAITGQTVRCTFTVDGQPVDAIATVTSVDGSNVKYDITTEARPIAKDLLARKITEQVAQQARLPVDSATCDGDLQPMVNATTSCTLVSANQPMNVTVTVTKVSGGLIRYSIKRA